MDLKLIKVNADIVSAIVAQWNHTGSLGDLERRLLVAKVTELYESIAAAEAGSQPEVPLDKKDAEVSLTEFSVEMEGAPEAGNIAAPGGEPGSQEARSDAAHAGIRTQEPENAAVAGEEAGQQEAQTATAPAWIETPEPESFAVAGEGAGAAGTRIPDDYPEGLRRGRTDRSVIRSLYEDDIVEVRTTFAEIDVEPCEEDGEIVAGEAEIPVSHAQEAGAGEPGVTGGHIKEPDAGESAYVYEENSAPISVPGENPAPAPSARPFGQKAVLGEVVGQGTHTLGETMPHPVNDVASRINSGRIDSISRHIGINDKYLMISELFGGDAEAYAAAMEILEGFAGIEDAILWIHDNHEWEADCRSAQLLMSLLMRKLT